MNRPIAKASFPRFLVAGAINTAASLLLYWLLLALGQPSEVSFAAAFAAGILLAWWLNSRFTFRTAVPTYSFVVYPLVYLGSWACGQWLLAALIAAGIPPWLAGLVASVAITPLSYCFNRLFFVRLWP
jgi:putative flippase GtrA